VFCTVNVAVVDWFTAGDVGDSDNPAVSETCPGPLPPLLLTVTVAAALVDVTF
jgi:hypothetical protein